jgi:demethylmenaquinone methyltransferase / 2-methoxy-6-polyprenyl-1,4-benzoquinol methylase
MDTEASRALFDENAATYDRVNTLISLGLDERWRRWAARQAVAHAGARVLDAFAGTGLVGIEAAALGARVTLADASPAMLGQAREHAARRGVEVATVLTDLTAEALPLPAASFDALTVSFGIRYLDDPAGTLRRLGRLLAADGRLVVLEFVRPDPGPVASPAAVYFFRVLPRIAARLAGRGQLYRYLVGSVDRVGHARDLVHLLEDAGYRVAVRRTFGFGLVAGVVCLPSA